MTKRIAALFLSLTLAGCVRNPYLFKTLPDPVVQPDAESKRFFFAYGNYCGPGYPREVGNDRVAQLESGPLPADDLDAICYAHDYCYALGKSQAICDTALHSMLIDYQSDFSRNGGKGCWNLTTDFTIAFFAKNWAPAASGAETFSNRLVSTALGLPFAAFWSVLKLPLWPFLGYPDAAGTCNDGPVPDSQRFVDEFEAGYRDTILNREHESIEVKLPGE